MAIYKEKMRNRVKINNLCITGTFRHNNKPNHKIEWTRKNILLYDNKILLKKQSFSVTLTQNIQKILQMKNLQKLFQKRLENELNMKIHDVKLRIGNIHESITIPCTPREVTEEFLPKVFKITRVESSQVSQEQNTPMLLNKEPLLKGHHQAQCCQENSELQNSTQQRQKTCSSHYHPDSIHMRDTRTPQLHLNIQTVKGKKNMQKKQTPPKKQPSSTISVETF